MPELAPLELLIGAASPAEARVYVRLPGAADGGKDRLTGYVRGPFCDFARTLPARIPFVDVAVERHLPQHSGRADSLLALATVPDPCFWTPALPMRYEAVVEVGGTSFVLPFGIRPLFRRGKRLLLDGQNWILRAVSADTSPEAPLADWRTAGAAMRVANPPERLCDEADRQGVLLVTDLSSLSAEDALVELRRLARHPSAGFVLLPSGQALSADPRPLAAGALLCQRIDPPAARFHAAIDSWAEIAIVETTDLSAAADFASNCPLPLIAYRPLSTPADVAGARRHCDALQSDLAGRADFAGYIV